MRLSGVAGCAAAESADMRLYLISYSFCPQRALRSLLDRISTDRDPHARVRRRPARPHRRRRGHAALRLQRRDDRRALPRHRRGLRRLPARHPLRAQGQLDAGDHAAAARPRQQRRRQLRRRDRRRAPRRVHPGADRLHRRRQDRWPSSPRPSISASARSTSSPPASSSGSTRCRASGGLADEDRDPHQSRRRREDPSAHLDRPEDQQVRHRRSATSRRCAPTRAASPASRSSACTRTSARRSPTSTPLRARPRARWSRWRASCAPTALASSTSISAAGSACRTTARACPTAQEYAAAVLPIVRESGLAIVLEPGRQIVAPAGALAHARRRRQRRRRDGKLFVVMDAGMTELIRPMLYNAFHRIEPVVADRRRAGSATSSGRCARAATRSARTGRCRARRSAT